MRMNTVTVALRPVLELDDRRWVLSQALFLLVTSAALAYLFEVTDLGLARRYA